MSIYWLLLTLLVAVAEAKGLHDMELAEWITPNDGQFCEPVRPIHHSASLFPRVGYGFLYFRHAHVS